MEALIVDTPFICMPQFIGTKPQIERKEKIMPLILASLVENDIIELLKET